MRLENEMGANVDGMADPVRSEMHTTAMDGDEVRVLSTEVVESHPGELLIRRQLSGQEGLRSGSLTVSRGLWSALPGTGLEVLWGEEAVDPAVEGAEVPVLRLQWCLDLPARVVMVWGADEAIRVQLTGRGNKFGAVQSGALSLGGTFGLKEEL